VEKLENYQEVLDTDQFFSRKNIPGALDMQIFQQVKAISNTFHSVDPKEFEEL